jgi:transcriptional regulator with XRE-family HTH domain
MDGEKLKILRELRNLSQEEVANELGIGQNTYSRIENNLAKLKADDAEKLAAIFGVALADLLSKDNPIISFTNNQIEKGYIHNHYEMQKEAVEELLKSKDAQIKLLTAVLETGRKEREQLLTLIERFSADKK